MFPATRPLATADRTVLHSSCPAAGWILIRTQADQHGLRRGASLWTGAFELLTLQDNQLGVLLDLTDRLADGWYKL